MKKPTGKILTFLAAVLLTLPFAAMAQGIVGDCADCHTMHNSEQGQPVAVQGLAGTLSVTPNENLLRMDCIACHAQGGNAKIVSMPGGSTIPQVYHQDSADLAAGNFAYISGTKPGHAGTSGNRKGHNVVDLVPAETDLSFPPGFRHAAAAIGEGGFDLDNFTCAGAMGCHGYRGQVLGTIGDPDCDPEFQICGEVTTVYRTGLAALSGFDGSGVTVTMKRGAHHDNYDGLKDDGLMGAAFYDSPLANSYRFIRSLRGYGNEVDRWQNIDANSHNEYAGGYDHVPVGSININEDFGATPTCSRCHVGGINATTSRITTPSSTMTGFCITCHGSFHSSGVTNGSSGAFLRHPSDYVIPDRGEYSAYTTYDVTAPVARPTAFFSSGMSSSPEVTPGTDLVMCLSCHVSHASPYDGMLRFDYSAMTAGAYADVATATAEGGCLACHTTKGVLSQNR